jgi:type II secretory pathway component PulF
MEFKYKAKKGLEEIIEGKIQADSLEQVIEKLEQQGMVAVSVEPQDPPKVTSKKKPLFLRFRIWGLRQLTLFTQKLYNLTKSHVELLTALRLLEQASNDVTEREFLEDIIKNIKDGMPFSDALSRYPQYFSSLYINIIRTGETSGQLKEALAQVLSYLQRLEGLRSKVRQALAYPLFMILVGVVTVFVMLTFVLPRLARIFEDFQASLPLPTRILLGSADFLKKYWLPIFIVLGLIVAILQRRQAGRGNFFSRIKYRLPIIRRLVYKQSLVNFSTSTALLLKSGTPLLSVLGLTSPIIGNPVYIKQLQQVCKDIKEGDSFSHALAKFKIFPDFFIQMIKVGEEGGRLDSALEDIAISYEQEIEADLKVISSLIEPAIILIVGLVIGSMVMAILLPIFNINTLVGS